MRQQPIIIGNWKLNPITAADAVTLAKGVAKASKPYTASQRLAVAPPFLFLSPVIAAIKKSGVAVFAQDGFPAPRGAHTGQISMQQLAAAGVTGVIIGHSERRALGETDAQVVEKVLAADKAKLQPVVCIGERERDERGDFYEFITAQLTVLAAGCSKAQLRRLIIAYEPIWAIGTGNTATAADVEEMRLFIIATLTKLTDRKTAEAMQLIYGGSVKPHNAAELYAKGGMRGFLVGGASLTAKDFAGIAEAVRTVQS